MKSLNILSFVTSATILIITNYHGLATQQIGNGAQILSRKRRVMGGVEESIDRYPYFVSVEVPQRNGIGICGGTIISPEWILTAAHCVEVDIDGTIVRSGTNAASCRKSKEHKVTRVVINEDFNDYSYHNDIALLKVFPSFEWDTTHQKINMFETDEEIKCDATAIAIGYGLSGANPKKLRDDRKLRSVNLPIVSGNLCFSLTGMGTNLYMGPETACAGYDGNGTQKSICEGDSGGPIIIHKRLAGVISWTVPCDEPERFPVVFTRISAYRDWIDDLINKSDKSTDKSDSSADKSDESTERANAMDELESK